MEGPLDLFYWGNIANNFLLAMLTSSVLDAGCTGLGILTSLVSGLSTMSFNDNPMTKSQSPSDFWGRRWNKIVGRALRRGVFLPLKNSGFSATISAFVTFLVSGLLHEYVLCVQMLRGGTKDPYTPAYGKQFFFFFWNGFILVCEHKLSSHSLVRWTTRLPNSLRTLLVLFLVMPVAHCFTDEYIASGFYHDLSFGFPRFFLLNE